MLDDRSLGTLLSRLRGLIVYGALAHTSPVHELHELLTSVEKQDAQGVATAYACLFRALLGDPRGGAAGTGLLPAVVDALLADENALSERAAAPIAVLPPALLAGAAHDLRALRDAALTGGALRAAAERLAGHSLPELPLASGPEDGIRGTFARCEDWGSLVSDLVTHYRAHGSGIVARFRAFRWAARVGGSLEPVRSPDAVDPGSLVGYQEERALLLKNTRQFVAGYRANNVLLYGDRGTGKSSSVKSLLWRALHPAEQAEQGWDQLRLVEVPKAHLAEFPAIVAQLRGRPQRFILFVDDLSFEDGETQYKEMKAMLEGGLEARPDNVVVYATSNRRHLVREQFADRARPGAEDVHAWDTVQEKLSFADRFGIAITFPTPDQAAFMAIVQGLARQRGLPLEPAALRARAVEWAAWHNGRSGRAARQLVDFLEGELGLAQPGER